MKITIESTTKIVTLDGIEARIWEGETVSGIKVHAYISRIAVRDDQDCFEFERELKECRVPSTEIAALPARLIL